MSSSTTATGAGRGRAPTASRRSFARLRETRYQGWLAMEPFNYRPDGPTCAARSIGYVSGLLEALA